MTRTKSKTDPAVTVDPINLTTISGVSVYRIQYVSEDLNGTYVPVTGFIPLPQTLSDSSKFPLVAYAHGAVGTNHGCAISNGHNLFDYSGWSLLSERGCALVGTDFAGLGLDMTDHQYRAFPAHAKDLFHSIGRSPSLWLGAVRQLDVCRSFTRR